MNHTAEGCNRLQSHPMWVRGLKLIMTNEKPLSIKSHPMWVRGLKLVTILNRILLPVAPYVGAWIETWCRASKRPTGWSHPMWVRGLKL